MGSLKGAKVRIVGDHPHAGETGVVDSGPYTSQTFPNWPPTWKVLLDDGNGDGCFADRSEMEVVRP